MGMSNLSDQTFLVEASWEVCNKVGGIHTVLISKMAAAQELVGKRYLAVGPVTASQPDFHQETPPAVIADVAKELKPLGILLKYGIWLTSGQPNVVLLDTSQFTTQLNLLKRKFWDKHQLDSLNAPADAEEPLRWSIAVGLFLEKLAAADPKSKLLFHGHEWLSAGAFLVVDQNPAIKTVFTTHATMLGRAISSSGQDLYDQLDRIDPEKAAQDHQVVLKHQLEKLAANLATVFTTVSEITARETKQFLGRSPDVITENGIEPSLFPAFNELAIQQQEMRTVLDDFVAAYFFPSYRFDLANTIYLFTMGRYEMHNKGYDLALQALAHLNQTLKKSQNPKTVVAWFFVPGDTTGVKQETLFQVAAQKRISALLTHYTTRQQRELYASLWEEGEHCANIEILSAAVIEQLKQIILRLPQPKEVPISPFNLRAGEDDDIVKTAAKLQLLNRAEDPVKVLFIPAYVDGFDGLFNRTLYELISGCDVGFFPSCYEPWGYTPMESLIMGVPAITSDLTGFGLAVKQRFATGTSGVRLLYRDNVAAEKAASNLSTLFQEYLDLTDRELLAERMHAYLTMQDFRWGLLYANYRASYEQALN